MTLRYLAAIGCLLLVGCTAPASTAADEFAITLLLQRHQISIDERDVDGYVSLFAPDATYESPFSTAHGREEIAAMAAHLHEIGFTRGKRHFAGPAAIAVDGHTARAHSHWWVADFTESPAVFATGTYRDELRKIDGRWYLTRRVLEQDGPPDGP